MSWVDNRKGFRVFITKITELEGGLENFISSLTSGEEPMEIDYNYSIKFDKTELSFLDLKLVEKIPNEVYLRGRGVDIDEFREQLFSEMKKKTTNIDDASLHEIIDAIMNQIKLKEHHLGIIRNNDDLYFVTANNDYDKQLKRVLNLTNLVLSQHSIPDVPDFLLWLTKKKFRQEVIGDYILDDIWGLKGIEEQKGYNDHHDSSGPKLDTSLPAMYQLTKSKYVSNLGMKFSSAAQNVSLEANVFSDFPLSSNTYFIQVPTINAMVPPQYYSFIKSIKNSNDKIPKPMKKTLFISIAVGHFLNAAVQEYRRELNSWKSKEKAKFLEDITREVNNDTK